MLDEGVRVESDADTAQGAVISPLLANIYFHDDHDLRALQWRQHTPPPTHVRTPIMW